MTIIRGGAAKADFERGSTTAVDELRGAVETARASNEAYAAAQMSEELAESLFQLGRYSEALSELDTSIDYYRTAGMHPYLARALKLRSQIMGATERGAEAAEALAEAVSIEAMMAERNKSQATEHA
jgi:tetratricopeptide (TPR) repeat protein